MKRFKYQGLGSILAGLLLSGCASTAHLDFASAPDRTAKRFVALEASAPPVGAMQFCAADPQRCGPQAAAFFSQGKETASNMLAVGGIEGAAGEAESRSEAFRYMLAARRENQARLKQAQADGVIFVSAAKSVRVTLTEELWAQLKGVQAEVNAALRPATDMQIYGKDEVWALPLEDKAQTGAPRGDCEDYALEKRLRLLNLGWAPEALSIVVVEAPRVGPHAVLAVSTDRGEFVLDNLQIDPVRAENLPYNWLSRQSGLDLLAWTKTSLVEQADPTAAPAAETLFASLLEARMERVRAQQEAEQAQMLAAIKLRETPHAETPAPVLIDVALTAASPEEQEAAEMTALASLLESGFGPYERFAPSDSGEASDSSVSASLTGSGAEGHELHGPQYLARAKGDPALTV